VKAKSLPARVQCCQRGDANVWDALTCSNPVGQSAGPPNICVLSAKYSHVTLIFMLLLHTHDYVNTSLPLLLRTSSSLSFSSCFMILVISPALSYFSCMSIFSNSAFSTSTSRGKVFSYLQSLSGPPVLLPNRYRMFFPLG
jgi:hypothetical protein